LRFPPPSKWQSRVLMPYDKPVGVWRFVKQGCAERECFTAEYSTRDLEKSRLPSQVSNGAVSEDVAHTSFASPQHQSRKVFNQAGHLIVREYARNNRESLLLDTFQ